MKKLQIKYPLLLVSLLFSQVSFSENQAQWVANQNTFPQQQQQPFATTNYNQQNYATNTSNTNVVQQQGALAVAQNSQQPPIANNQVQNLNGQQPLPPLQPPAISNLEKVASHIAPFKPSEVRDLKLQYNDFKRANAYEEITVLPKISSVAVDLSPGASLPIVRVMPGQTSTLIFVDSTGAPWNLAVAPRVSDSSIFDVEWLKDSSALVISALSSFKEGNLSVFLDGSPTPVIVKLVTAEKDSQHDNVRIVDYRLDLRLPGRGPNAKPAFKSNPKIDIYSDVLQAFLDNVPPPSAKLLKLDNTTSDLKVWEFENKFFVRTHYAIQSSFDQSISSSDGTVVYQLSKTPLLSLSENGQSVTYKISD